MKYPIHRPFIGLLLILVIVGCSNRGTVALSGGPAEMGSAQDSEVASPKVTTAVVRANDRPMPAPPISSVQNPAIPQEVLVTTKLVSATAAPNRPRRSLVTLPPGGDLMGQIGQASGPVILDFYATWCGPCRVQGDILHEFEMTAARSNALIIKIDVDQHPEIARELGIQSLPTLMVVRDGNIVHQKTGVASIDQLASWTR